MEHFNFARVEYQLQCHYVVNHTGINPHGGFISQGQPFPINTLANSKNRASFQCSALRQKRELPLAHGTLQSLELGRCSYTFEDLNPHAFGVLFISFKGNVADK